MTLFLGWIVLPLVLTALSLGCGLLLETVSGMRLPGPLLLPGGFIALSLFAYFAHMTDATAPLQTPLVVVLAATGYGLSRPWKRFQLDRWLAAAVAGVYFVFGAPVLLSGMATFLGYIRLDDTATYMAMLDRLTTHAYNNAGLHSSTYKAVLHQGYVFGYPLGSLLPLDVGQTIVRVDPLWLWQPYLTFLAVLTALGLYQLASGLVQSRALRAGVAFFGAQAALIYGYAAWGGVKELFLPSVVLFAACLVPHLRERGTPPTPPTEGWLLALRQSLPLELYLDRKVIPLAAASAAVISGLSVGGGIWIIPTVVAGLILLFLHRPVDEALRAVWSYVVAAGFLAFPILTVGLARLFHIGKFLKGGEVGNIRAPLSGWEVFGIWPGGDFRSPTTQPGAAHLLGTLVAVAGIFAAVIAWRRRRWEAVVVLVTAVFATVVYVERATVWVGSKALASSSPLVLGVGLLGVAMAIESVRRQPAFVAVGIAVLAVLGGSVLWSNTMQYHAVQLAPAPRLMELEKIASMYNGQGPALLTEFEPYGARHLLRGLDAEATSELRVRLNCLYKGSPLTRAVKIKGKECHEPDFGTTPDVGEIRLDQLVKYKMLIMRRSGTASRPPSIYTRVWQGKYYDVWRRDGDPSSIIDYLSVGSRYQPAAKPVCSDVMNLAQEAAAAGGSLEAVIRPPVIIIDGLDHIGPPKQWYYPYGETPNEYYKTYAWPAYLRFKVPKAGVYDVWAGGSFSSTLTMYLDRYEVGRMSNQTEWPGTFLYFGSRELAKGPSSLGMRHSGPDLSPGSAAIQSFGLGPFVIAPEFASKITTVEPDKAQSLCGKYVDWVEAVRH